MAIVTTGMETMAAHGAVDRVEADLRVVVLAAEDFPAAAVAAVVRAAPTIKHSARTIGAIPPSL